MDKPNPGATPGRDVGRPLQARLFRRRAHGRAAHIGWVALLADSIDVLKDACINARILLALGWSAANRARAEMAWAEMAWAGMAWAGIWRLP